MSGCDIVQMGVGMTVLSKDRAMFEAAMSRVKGDVAMPKNLPQDQGKPGPNSMVKLASLRGVEGKPGPVHTRDPGSDTDFNADPSRWVGFQGNYPSQLPPGIAPHTSNGSDTDFDFMGHQPAFQYGAMAINSLMGHQNNMATNGTSLMEHERWMSSVRPKMGGDEDEEGGDDHLPIGNGYSYMTHLFRARGMAEKARKKAKHQKQNGSNIFTEDGEALKLAMNVLGVASDKNPNGMPIEIKEAKQLFFGGKDMSHIEESEWRTNIERGDSKIDPKRVRKFVNYDGSITYEVLNTDKTVMSRFTMGEYKGTKVFAQGGYGKFADTLKKVKKEAGPDSAATFDAINSSVAQPDYGD